MRYDSNVGRWAVLNEKNESVRHFTHGFMENVSLSSVAVTIKTPGCGGGTSTSHLGLAEGTLREGVYSPELSGLKNLGFYGGNFYDNDNKTVASAKVLQLMPNRRSLFA